MNPNIDYVLNTFYQRGIIAREQLLTEILRVKRTLAIVSSYNDEKILDDKERVFQLMKKETEQELGFFPGDRDLFIKVFNLCRDVDLIEYTLEIYKNDRMGVVVAPSYLTELTYHYIDKEDVNAILITEAEKHLAGLVALVEKYPAKEFVFTTQLYQMFLMLSLGFEKYENVQVTHQSIYTEPVLEGSFDYIYCLPAFGGANQPDGIAIENMLPLLSPSGTLSVIVPARTTFAGGSAAKLREYITQNYNLDSILIVPEGTFRPYTAIKTYMLSISKESQSAVTIGTMEYEDNKLSLSEQKEIPTSDFLKQEDWRVELMLSEDNENIKRFKSSNLVKVKLKDVAEVFRGKSILKKDTAVFGNIYVLNISNIENGEIDYSEMDTIEEDERKVKRYELAAGDVVLSCRGTAIKSAVFAAQDKTIIASANLIVIRPQKKVMGGYIHIFLSSPIGLTLIKSFQRGTTVMNINHSDIMEIEIPLIPLSEQEEMVKEYQQELDVYKKSIREARSRWTSVRDSLYNKLT